MATNDEPLVWEALAEVERLRAVIAEQQAEIVALVEDKRQLVVGFEAVNAQLRLKSS